MIDFTSLSAVINTCGTQMGGGKMTQHHDWRSLKAVIGSANKFKASKNLYGVRHKRLSEK